MDDGNDSSREGKRRREEEEELMELLPATTQMCFDSSSRNRSTLCFRDSSGRMTVVVGVELEEAKRTLAGIKVGDKLSHFLMTILPAII